MNILYLTWIQLEPQNRTGEGVHKKIYAQVNALRKLGNEVFLCSLNFSNKTISLYRHNSIDIIKEKSNISLLRKIKEFIQTNKIKFAYIRNNNGKAQLIVGMLLYFLGVKSYLEIPTYPFSNENKIQSGKLSSTLKRVKSSFLSAINGLFIKRIVTFSNDRKIWGVPTINISNGIDYKDIPLKRPTTSECIRITAVAMMSFWHGYDRLIEGVKEYLNKGLNKDQPIKVTIAGGPEDSKELLRLRILVKSYGLKDTIILPGVVYGSDLDQLFDNSDICVGSLGRHRSGIKEMKALKNVEYALRGLPFCYSENNPDFDNAPYVYKIPADETPIDIQKIIQFYKSLKLTPKQIRDRMPDLSWGKQMGVVLKEMASHYNKINN